ncbi:hypothetical protein BGW38_005244, partial [Lunasporangiospora selenospora]
HSVPSYASTAAATFGRTAKTLPQSITNSALAFFSAAGAQIPQSVPGRHGADLSSPINESFITLSPQLEAQQLRANPRLPFKNAPEEETCLVITNFRILSCTSNNPAHPSRIHVQVPLGSIATMARKDYEITLSLRFDPAQYIVQQQSKESPMILEIVSILRKLIFLNDDVSARFPFRMGQTLLSSPRISGSSGHTTDGSTDAIGRFSRHLWTAEEILTFPYVDEEDMRIQETTPTGGVEGNMVKISAKESMRRTKHLLGWSGGYDIFTEFNRLGSIAHVNSDFGLSPTYPEWFIMPAIFLQQIGESERAAHDQTQGPRNNAFLKQLCNFRSNGRFPLLCWKAPDSGLVIMRSAQPMVGFLGSRGTEDEHYVRLVLSTAAKQHRSPISSQSPLKLCIIDARGYTSAVANGYVGGGHENPGKFSTLKPEVVAVVASHADSSNWHPLIESTGWLNHVAEMLKAASGRDGIVGKLLHDNCSILVLLHSRTDSSTGERKLSTTPDDDDEASSDPWYNPMTRYNRHKNGVRSTSIHKRPKSERFTGPSPKLDSATIPPFSYRMDHPGSEFESGPDTNGDWQNPNRFEYNDYLLLVLARAVNGCSPFGDFMYNNEQERTRNGLRERTVSIWKWIERHRGWFINGDYVPDTLGPMASWKERVLQVQTGGRHLSLWTEYYFNMVPPLFPDPRLALSTVSIEDDIVYHYRTRRRLSPVDHWRSHSFGSTEEYPTFISATMCHAGQRHGHRSPKSPRVPTRTRCGAELIIPPALANLSRPEKRIHDGLVRHVRKARRRKLNRAFTLWKMWAKRRKDERPAREAGFVVTDEHLEECSSESTPDRKLKLDKPVLIVVNAKKGLKEEIGKVMEETPPFFGDHELVFETRSSEDEEQGTDDPDPDLHQMGGVWTEDDGMDRVLFVSDLADALDDPMYLDRVDSVEDDTFIAL